MKYTLPELTYNYEDLEPYMDAETVKLHHSVHHASYVNNANKLVSDIEEARNSGDFSKIRALSSSLSFNLSGHYLHSLFWRIMGPPSGNSEIDGEIKKQIEVNFGSVDNFFNIFNTLALTVEGSGWAVLTYDPINKDLHVSQIEKHNMLGISNHVPILALDVWEHAYYLKYKSDRKAFIEAFKNLINWEAVEKEYLNIV
ncbi:superoxide dismutase [Patescibacteria group bacterium]|nr:superoxide dismutase [Patescibacteria group bacterium]